MQIVWAIVSLVGAAALLVGLPAVLLSEGKAGQWRRAVKWTAIGTGVYIVVAFGLLILSYQG